MWTCCIPELSTSWNDHFTYRLMEKPISPSEEEWQKMALPKNEIGEIVVAGPHVLKKYYKNPKAQARQKFEVDGRLWHRTGDSGFLDADENLFLTGPAKYIFKKEGKPVCPFPVEMQLQKLISVREGTILKKHNQAVLFVVLETGCSAAEAEVELKQTNILYYRVEFLDSLPKDPRHHAKIEYGKLLAKG